MNSLETFTEFLSDALAPLTSSLETSAEDELKEFLEEIGYILPDGVSAFSEFQEAAIYLGDTLAALKEQQPEIDGSDGNEEELLAILAILLAALVNYFVRLHQLPDKLRDTLSADYLAKTRIDENVVERLYAYLISALLEDNYPAAYGALKIVGIIDLEEFESDETNFQPEFTLVSIHWQRIGQLFSDPGQLFEDVYGWGTPEIDAEKFYQAIIELTTLLSIPAELREPTIEALESLAPGLPDDEDDIEREIWIPILQIGDISFNLVVQVLPNTSDTDPQSISISLQVTAGFEEEFQLAERLFLTISSSMDLSTGISVVLQPNRGLRINLDTFIAGPGSLIEMGEAAVQISYKNPAGSRLRILTISNDAFLELQQVYLKPGIVYLPSDEEFDFLVELGLIGGRFIYQNSESDGFINNVLPQNPVESNFDLVIGWSKRQGLTFKGSGSLEIALPAHIGIGPINIETIYFILGFQTDPLKFPLEVSAAISANLGPLQASVDRLGIKLDFDVVGSGGELGPFDVDIGFKPPNGVGLAIDAGTVKGGGYLYFDYDNERYAGALELYIEGLFALKAIALITTRMPDGSKGFSLLIIITAEFGTPIQLGYGFTLSGVGGLLGLHRTMRLEPMLEGVRTGAINSVMFPDDLIANAPRIISDLRNFFPPYVGIFLIGPMAKLGWSTPNLITLSLGVIIEIPGNVAIVGILKAVLPHEEAAILKLQVNFLGAIEFDKKRAYLFAALYDSRVLFITLEGEMGVLVAWGNNPNLVLSVGGFHPSFDPPPLPFPTPKRIAISILNTSVAKVRVEGYFAITSNTAQFGAKAELFFGLSEFKIEGHLSFNALFRFSPFYFEISISVSLSVKVFGIGLFSVRFRGSLEGPTPWHIEGTGSISLLFFDISVDFSKTWGESKETTLPPITIMPLLKGEFEKLENWQAVVPAANNLLVSLREIEASEDLVLHPVGTLKISQRAVPLQFKLDKLGTQKPADNNYFDIDISGDDFEVIDEVLESHATAQIKNVSDKQKLSLPPYSDEKGGIELSVKGEQLKTSSAIKRVVRYEQIIIDNNFKRGVNHFVELIATFFRFFVKNGAVGKSPLSNKVKKQQMPFTDKIAVKTNTFVVANNSDNTPLAGEVIEFASYFKAEQYMDEQIKGDPTMRDNVHVIPHAEMREAV